MPKMPKTKQNNLAGSGKFGNRLRRPAPPKGKPFLLDLDEFQLRSLKPGDASQEFTRWMGDPEVTSGINIPELKMSVEGLARYIATFDNMRKYLIGIFVKPEMKLIGFYQIDVVVRHRTATITAIIGNKDWWGRNVFKQTARGLVDAFFETRNLDKMSVRVTSRNRKVLFSLLGTRFEYEGCLKGEAIAPDGERIDMYVFGRLKSSPP